MLFFFKKWLQFYFFNLRVGLHRQKKIAKLLRISFKTPTKQKPSTTMLFHVLGSASFEKKTARLIRFGFKTTTIAATTNS